MRCGGRIFIIILTVRPACNGTFLSVGRKSAVTAMAPFISDQRFMRLKHRVAKDWRYIITITQRHICKVTDLK